MKPTYKLKGVQMSRGRYHLKVRGAHLATKHIKREVKRCPKCDITKSVALFYSDKSKYDGIDTYCKECRKYNYREYYKNNIDKCKTTVKKWQKEDRKLNPKKYKVRNKKWRKNNKEWVTKYNKEYYTKSIYLGG